jgi:hypothetical protein
LGGLSPGWVMGHAFQSQNFALSGSLRFFLMAFWQVSMTPSSISCSLRAGFVEVGGAATPVALLGDVDPLFFLSSEPQALPMMISRKMRAPIARIVFPDKPFFGGVGGGGGVRGGAN